MTSIQPLADRPIYPKTVVTELTGGGLGNQMFQFAFGLAVARKLNAPFEWVRMPRARSREFGLGMFGIEEAPYYAPWTVYRNSGCGDASDMGFAEAAIARSEVSHCGLRGHFQNEECFAPVADEIRELFKIEPIRKFENQVSLQVRRGDYAGNPLYDVCKPTYFWEAIRHFEGEPMFVVVSDDLEWCRETFKGFPYVHVPDSQTTEEGLRLMAGSDAHIISNSTYGWWGAWLSGGPVVVPDRWLNGQWKGHEWTCAPERWTKISV